MNTKRKKINKDSKFIELKNAINEGFNSGISKNSISDIIKIHSKTKTKYSL